jgi:regulatory protein
MVSRVLERKTAAWARRAARTQQPEVVAAELAACRETIAAVVERLREVRLVDDASFAETRARRLGGEGRSRRAIAAHLEAKGVDSTTARQALPDAESELAAALVFARKRRIGPFERDAGRSWKGDEDDERRRGLTAMARAGYDWDLCERIFAMDLEQAEEIIARSRR